MMGFFQDLVWVNVQAGIWAALLFFAAMVLERGLRGRFPGWRKGAWLGVMVLPPVIVVLGLAVTADYGLLPADWMIRHHSPALAAEGNLGLRILGWTLFTWVAGTLVLEGLGALRLARVVWGGRDVVDDRIVGHYSKLAGTLRGRTPRLLESERVSSPFILAGPVTGVLIVLPRSMMNASDEAVVSVLAHELAHARACDPWVVRGLSLIRCLFPLAWLAGGAAAREYWDDAAEQTGDLRAIRTAKLGVNTYKTVLKEAALSEGWAAEGSAMGFAPEGFSSATRAFASKLLGRLRNINLARNWSESSVRFWTASARAVLVGGCLTLLAGRAMGRDILADPRLEATDYEPRDYDADDPPTAADFARHPELMNRKDLLAEYERLEKGDAGAKGQR